MREDGEAILEKKACLVRKWALISTTEAGSGHPTSCLSAADVATVLFDKFFTYDVKNPKNPNNDRFVLSKGHAAPLLYTLFALSGAFPLEKLRTLRKFDSILEGHPTPRFPFAEAATGSLGQGLSVGAGIAYALRQETHNSKLITHNSPKVYVLLGDGEMAEGSVWEAANFASYYSLNNLIAIVDVNRFGQSQETMFGHDAKAYVDRLIAFGWKTTVIDGHNFDEIEEAFEEAVNNESDKPFAIVAKTKKGKGVSFFEDKDGWHGKPLKKDELEKALAELGEVDDGLRFELEKSAEVGSKDFLVPQFSPEKSQSLHQDIVARKDANAKNFAASPRLDINYKIGDAVATREVYGQVLAQLANDNPFIYALDGDVKNSTYSQDFKKVHPDRFIECFIAEQNMVGVALGLSSQGKIPFVSTFAAFLTRAFDQIRMAAISQANMKFVGSHAGVSIGEDGPSQMGLEDIAMFGAIPESIILHPADALSTEKLIPHMARHKGISYLRTLRSKTPVLYDIEEEFTIGGSKVLRENNNDQAVIVGTGITVHEALAAHEQLEKEGVSVSVVDCYSVKPIDEDTIIKKAKQSTTKTIVVVEDHFYHGGLGDMVLNAVAGKNIKVVKLAVTEISRSGTPAELLDAAGISARHIVEKVKSLM